MNGYFYRVGGFIQAICDSCYQKFSEELEAKYFDDDNFYIDAWEPITDDLTTCLVCDCKLEQSEGVL